MSQDPLLPLRPEFLARLSAARGLAYPFFRGFHPRTAISGPPTEFDGHRPYLPGDDTRWIDWNLFARLEELFVKVYQVEEEVEVLIMVDTSLSMTSGNGRKHRVAAATAAAFSYLGLITAHPVSVIRYADRALDRRGPYRHIQAFPSLTELLLAPSRGEGTDLGNSLSPFLLHQRRPVTVIVLTDGFQKEPLERALAAVKSLDNRRGVVVRMVDPADSRPSLRGNLNIRNVEGAGNRTILSDATLERQLHRRIEGYFLRLEEGLLQADVDLYGLSMHTPFEKGFLDILQAALPAELKAVAP